MGKWMFANRIYKIKSRLFVTQICWRNETFDRLCPRIILSSLLECQAKASSSKDSNIPGEMTQIFPDWNCWKIQTEVAPEHTQCSKYSNVENPCHTNAMICIFNCCNKSCRDFVCNLIFFFFPSG